MDSIKYHRALYSKDHNDTFPDLFVRETLDKDILSQELL